MRTNNKNINSAMNAVFSLCSTFANGLLGVVVTKLIISFYGSDFNGLNSTANQIVSVLLIVEGGFTLASNYALFRPVRENDFETVNGILVATRIQFRKVGVVFALCGLVVSIVYAYVVNSELSRELIITIMFMTVFPRAFNLFYTAPYNVLLQAQQKEYVYTGYSLATIVLGHLTNIVIIVYGGPMWSVRFVTMVFSLLNSMLVVTYVKKHNKYIDFTVASRREMITGTQDVMFQKITSVVYNSFPIVYLSISPSGGTILASVYAVYNNVFLMIKGIAHSIVDAPRLSLGQLLNERKRNESWGIFRQYEYLAFIISFVFMLTTYAIILPFVELYTNGVTDANYYDQVIAILLSITVAIEIIHIPSGHLINMAGKFSVGKNIQSVACVFLIVSICVTDRYNGLHGMLIAMMATSILLACMEMGYVHIHYFLGKGKELFRMILPFGVCSLILGIVESNMDIRLNNYLEFVICGIIFFVVHAFVAGCVSMLFNKNVFWELCQRMLDLIKKRTRQ